MKVSSRVPFDPLTAASVVQFRIWFLELLFCSFLLHDGGVCRRTTVDPFSLMISTITLDTETLVWYLYQGFEDLRTEDGEPSHCHFRPLGVSVRFCFGSTMSVPVEYLHVPLHSLLPHCPFVLRKKTSPRLSLSEQAKRWGQIRRTEASRQAGRQTKFSQSTAISN